MSVPARRGPWWYYTRTEEGKDYAIHCRRPARGREELPPAGEPGDEEQVLLDENALAEGSDYFAVGSAAVSHDHRWLAYSTDRAGNEKYELRFRPLDAETPPTAAAESVPDTGYGLAWSAEADYVFYVRLDEAQRPYQLWRHRLGTDPAGDVLVFEEADRRFSLGHRVDPRRRLRADRAAQHQHHRVARHPRGRPARRAARSSCRAARGSSTRSTTSRPPAAGRAGSWRSPTTAPGTSGSSPPPTPALGRGPGDWREVVAHRPGVRIEDVDAFARRLVLSERAEAADPGARPARCAERGDPFGGDLLGSGWIVPSIDSPVVDLAGRQPRARRAGAAHRAHLARHAVERPAGRPGRPRGDAAQAGARPGRLRPGALHDLPRVGRRPRRDAGPDLGRAPPRTSTLPAPAVLYGYGAYEISIDPSFSHHRLSLLDRGVVFAIAHVRGGGEMGRAWYEDGRMEHKANTFSDFIAVPPATWSTRASPGRARWPAGAAPPAGCSSAPWPTRRPSSSAPWWPRCPSSTASPPCSTTSSR